MKKILLTTLTVFALSFQFSYAYATFTTEPVAKKVMAEVKAITSKKPSVGSTYKAALKIATAEQKKAKKVSMEWNTIGGKKGLLAKAKKLNKKGDVKGAIKLLNLAAEHGRLGQKQAIDQANAGPVGF